MNQIALYRQIAALFSQPTWVASPASLARVLHLLNRTSNPFTDISVGQTVEDGVEIHAADAVWLNTLLIEPTSMLPAYVARLYALGSELLQYEGQDGHKDINSWVTEKTRGLIREVVDASQAAKADLIAVNALRFAGKWHEPFVRTYDGPFRCEDGDLQAITFMCKTAKVRHVEYDDFCAVELPYGSTGRYSMVLATLPDVPDDLFEVLDAAPAGTIDIHMPRFRVASTADMRPLVPREILESGCPWITGAPLSIGPVTQSAVIDVAEQGTSAGAATMVAMLKSLRPTLIFDRPFAYFIVERSVSSPGHVQDESPRILFCGSYGGR